MKRWRRPICAAMSITRSRCCAAHRDTDIKRWKAEHTDQRQQMKALQLGINYGMGVRSLARGLAGIP